MEADGVEIKDTHLVLGEPQKEIVKLGEELEAGLVAIGSRGLGGLARALMGSVSDAVVRHTHCPVLFVRAADRTASRDPERAREGSSVVAGERRSHCFLRT